MTLAKKTMLRSKRITNTKDKPLRDCVRMYPNIKQLQGCSKPKSKSQNGRINIKRGGAIAINCKNDKFTKEQQNQVKAISAIAKKRADIILSLVKYSLVHVNRQKCAIAF